MTNRLSHVSGEQGIRLPEFDPECGTVLSATAYQVSGASSSSTGPLRAIIQHPCSIARPDVPSTNRGWVALSSRHVESQTSPCCDLPGIMQGTRAPHVAHAFMFQFSPPRSASAEMDVRLSVIFDDIRSSSDCSGGKCSLSRRLHQTCSRRAFTSRSAGQRTTSEATAALPASQQLRVQQSVADQRVEMRVAHTVSGGQHAASAGITWWPARIGPRSRPSLLPTSCYFRSQRQAH